MLTPNKWDRDLLGAMKAPSIVDPMHFVGLTDDLVGIQDELKDRKELVLYVKVSSRTFTTEGGL